MSPAFLESELDADGESSILLTELSLKGLWLRSFLLLQQG